MRYLQSEISKVSRHGNVEELTGQNTHQHKKDVICSGLSPLQDICCLYQLVNWWQQPSHNVAFLFFSGCSVVM
jgi:hypothetical protein